MVSMLLTQGYLPTQNPLRWLLYESIAGPVYVLGDRYFLAARLYVDWCDPAAGTTGL